MPGFQQSVNIQPAKAIPGDFASGNPRNCVLAGPGAFVAGPAGVLVGSFAWTDPTDTQANNFGAGVPRGFIARELQAVITAYPGSVAGGYASLVPAGLPITLYDQGDFWALTTTPAFIGQKIFANFGTGAVSTGATGSTPAGASVTATIAPSTTLAATGSIASVATPSGDPGVPVLNVTAVSAGTVVPGTILSGTGIVAGTSVISQLTGTTGGIGTYEVSVPQTVASTAIGGTVGLMTVTATGSGTLGVGQVVTGAGVTAGTVITGLGTGTGGNGTYYVSPSQTEATSETMTTSSGVETKFFVANNCNAGELVKFSSWGA
jgi:hypothetical protein